MERFTSVLRSAIQEVRLLTYIRFDGGTPISRAISSSRCMLNPAGPERFTFSPQQMSRNGFSESQGPRPNACDSALETTTKEQLSKCVFISGCPIVDRTLA